MNESVNVIDQLLLLLLLLLLLCTYVFRHAQGFSKAASASVVCELVHVVTQACSCFAAHIMTIRLAPPMMSSRRSCACIGLQ